MTNNCFAILRALQHWEYYIIQKEFVLHNDQQALEWLNSQRNIYRMHAKWIIDSQKFNFFFKHKTGQQNRVANSFK